MSEATQSASVVIRRASVKDAPALARQMADPLVYTGLMQMPYGSEEQWVARLSEMAAPGKSDLLLVAEIDGEVVGSAGLHPCGPAIRRRHAMTLGISVVPGFQRRGIGAELMAALCDYAEKWAGVLRLELTVYADNVVAQRLYRRFGFELEGRMRGYAMRDGRYVDALSMARINRDPARIEPASIDRPRPAA